MVFLLSSLFNLVQCTIFPYISLLPVDKETDLLTTSTRNFLVGATKEDLSILNKEFPCLECLQVNFLVATATRTQQGKKYFTGAPC